MPRRLRVLHVVGAMNYGGVENWLMALLRRAAEDSISMDFLVHTNLPAAHDAEIRALGGRILPCPSVHSARYLREFDRALTDNGPYDVLHSHVHWFSGLTTTLARWRGVRMRIAHSHSDSRVMEAKAGIWRAAYRKLMRSAIFGSATHLLAASETAGGALFGVEWRQSSRAQLLYCGVDLAPFRSSDCGKDGDRDGRRDRESVRREFGIADNEVVLGHVGNLHWVKNHAFLGSVAAEAGRCHPSVRVLCIGTGSLEQELRNRFEEAGVRAIFAGARKDVPRLLRAMDVFIFPSIYEGLPLALLEAQAAGLPCVVSSSVTREVDVVPGLIRWLPLSSGVEIWAEAALAAAMRPPRGGDGLAMMAQSHFSAENSFSNLSSIYRSQGDATNSALVNKAA